MVAPYGLLFDVEEDEIGWDHCCSCPSGSSSMSLSSYTQRQLYYLSRETYRDREKQLCPGRRDGGRAYKRQKYSNSYGLKQQFSKHGTWTVASVSNP